MTKPREGRGNLKLAPLKLFVLLRDESLKSCCFFGFFAAEHKRRVDKALRDEADIGFLNIQ